MNNTIEEKLSCIEEQHKQIEERLSRAEAWTEKWSAIIKAIAERDEEAKRHNKTLILTETFNPWASTTTVDQLLTWLEAECPLFSAVDALSKKDLTDEEHTQLISDLESIASCAIEAIKAFKQKRELQA